jgi:hypothetical protein
MNHGSGPHHDGILLHFGVCLITRKCKPVEIRGSSAIFLPSKGTANRLQGNPLGKLGSYFAIKSTYVAILLPAFMAFLLSLYNKVLPSSVGFKGSYSRLIASSINYDHLILSP